MGGFFKACRSSEVVRKSPNVLTFSLLGSTLASLTSQQQGETKGLQNGETKGQGQFFEKESEDSQGPKGPSSGMGFEHPFHTKTIFTQSEGNLGICNGLYHSCTTFHFPPSSPFTCSLAMDQIDRILKEGGAVESLHALSDILSTGLDRRVLGIVLHSLEGGVHPESIVDGE
jgi:hypothetical protein